MLTNNIVKKSSSGFIALLVVLCISLVLLATTLELTSTGWYTRYTVLGREQKAQSEALARACLSVAVLRITIDTSYVGNATTTYPVGTCYIFPLQLNIPTAGTLTLHVRAKVQNTLTSLVATYNMHDIQLDSVPDALPSTGAENTSATVDEWHEVFD